MRGAAGWLAAGLLAMAAPAGAQMNPPTAPGSDLNLTANFPGDRKIGLHFREPSDDGGSTITRYEYRAKVATGTYPTTWTRVPEFTGTVGSTLELFFVVEQLSDGTALVNGTQYAVQVRAVNSVGAGQPAEVMATPQANVPAVFSPNNESGVITRRPFAPAPRVPAQVLISMVGNVLDDDNGFDTAGDGDDRFTFQWEWIRVRNGNETVIRGAGAASSGSRASRYTLTPADVGSQLKVKMRFRDDHYNQEEFVSALFPASGTILPAATCVAPTYTGGATQLWSEEITIEDVDHDQPTPNRYGVGGIDLDTDMFTAGSNPYTIDWIYRATTGSEAGKLIFGLTADLTQTDKNQLTLHVCDEAYPLIDATLQTSSHDYEWPSSEDWSTYITRTIFLSRDAVAPTVTRARISGASLTITFSENLDGDSMPPTTAFTVNVDDTTVDLASGSTAAITGNTVTLTLAEAPSSGSTITVSYARPGTGNLRDPALNEVLEFTDQIVTRPRPRVVLRPPSAPQSLLAKPGDSQVVLGWKAPASSGGRRVTRYEVRYAEGDSVPAGAPWQSVELDLKWTVADLTNGQQYAFEVRAVNSVGPGRAAIAAATPRTVPLAPVSLTATAGDAEVILTWSAPTNDGGAPIERYEYRYAAGDAVPQDTAWQDAGTARTATVKELENARRYAFEVRAVNPAGPGPAAFATATPRTVPLAPVSLTATAGDAEVILTWSAPTDDGGAPIERYEYRYAEGDAVAQDTAWQDAGTARTATVKELENARRYTFEVRAVNPAGPGPAAFATTTPRGPPLMPASVSIAAGNAEVVLTWSAPTDDGGALIERYEYRYAEGDAVAQDTPWQSAGSELTAAVTGLENEVRYAFEVRAVNRVGAGPAATTTGTPIRLQITLVTDAASATEGEPLAVRVRRSGGVAYAAHAYVGATDSAVPGVTATDTGRDDGLGRQRLEFAAGVAEATVTITPSFDGLRPADRTLTVTLESAQIEIYGRHLSYELDTAILDVTVTDADAAVSVADARAEPGETVLRFRVSLDRTRNVPMQVDYATADGTARAGQDYTAVSGTLTFEPDLREADVEVPVLATVHLSGERVLRLRLSNPRNAVIADGEATGTIARVSDLPQAWITRFGRTASDQSAQAIRRRLEGGERESHLTVAGLRVNSLMNGLGFGASQSADFGQPDAPFATAGRVVPGPAHALTGRSFGTGDLGGIAEHSGLANTVPRFHPGGLTASSDYSSAADSTGGAGLRLPTLREALIGTSFYYTAAAAQDEGGTQSGNAAGADSTGRAALPPGWTVWGDVATTGFDGAQGGLTLDGDVVTGTVGFDFQTDSRWLGGLAVSYSDGAGDYAERGSEGKLNSTLTSVHPYAHYRLSERTQIWGVLGYGSGDFELTPEGGEALGTDLSNRMVALGGRSVVRRPDGAGTFELSLNSDVLWTSTRATRRTGSPAPRATPAECG